METLEELKAIIDNAPEGATDFSNRFNRHLFYKYSFLLGWFYWDGGCYMPLNTFPSNKTRSLSDIERIIELMELNQNMHTTVAGYIYGKDWAHWNEFNAGKFKL